MNKQVCKVNLLSSVHRPAMTDAIRQSLHLDIDACDFLATGNVLERFQCFCRPNHIKHAGKVHGFTKSLEG